MEKTLRTALSYFMTGAGLYHIFLGNGNMYGLIILMLGTVGIMINILDKKL